MRRASVTHGQLCPCQVMVKPLQLHAVACSSHSATLGEGRLLCPLLCAVDLPLPLDELVSLWMETQYSLL